MKLVLLVVLALGFSSQAMARTCFWKRSASSFSVPEDTEGVMHVRAGREYKLTLKFCRQRDLETVHNISFRTWPRSSSRVCKGDQVVLHEYGSGWETTCNIREIERL